jgi:hypothetical protein
MKERSSTLLLWGPRIFGILVCLFLSLFALDAFGNGKTSIEALPDFARHVAPVLALLAVVGISWRREWVGALVFTALAIGYAYAARDHMSWVCWISTPLLVAGVLYFSSWLRRRDSRLERGQQTPV